MVDLQKNSNDATNNAANEPTEEQVINEIYDYAAHLLMTEHKSPEEATKELIKNGLDSESATVVINNLQLQIKQAKKDGAAQNMFYGVVCFVIGIAITLGTMAMANDGGTYVLAWGAILFGGLQFLYGFLGYAYHSITE
jgi:hypothetical protein